MVPEGSPEGVVRTPKQVQRRLGPGKIADLIAGYRAGVEVGTLAEQFGMHRSTVITHARRRGVPGRKGVLVDEIVEARLLHEQGWSPKRVAEHFGVATATVWNAFRAAGVPRRPRRGTREIAWADSVPECATYAMSAQIAKCSRLEEIVSTTCGMCQVAPGVLKRGQSPRFVIQTRPARPLRSQKKAHPRAGQCLA